MYFIDCKWLHFDSISQNVVCKDPKDDKPALVHMKAWCQAIIWTNNGLVCTYASHDRNGVENQSAESTKDYQYLALTGEL